MNFEQQYRTGRLTTAPAVPQWVRDEAGAISRRDAEAVRDVCVDMRFAMAQQCGRTVQVQEARAVLGITGAMPDNLLAHTTALVAADPASEPQYWEAMWVLRRIRLAEQDYWQHLPEYADVLEAQERMRDQGWPSSWSWEFCEFWRRLGGSAASARAWDRAGWMAEQVLTLDVTHAGHTLTLRERLECLQPPHSMPTTSVPTRSEMPSRNRMSMNGGTR